MGQPKTAETLPAKKDNVYEIEISPSALIQAAIENKAPIDVMERLMAMRDKLIADQAKMSFRDAMALFQAACPVVVKSAGVDYTSKRGSKVKYNYAPLDVIVDQVKKPLADNGLSYTFTTEQTETSVTAICHAHHVDGHTESTSFTIPIDLEAFMNAAQKVASALTYAKRYAFCNAFGILTGDEDDDATSQNKDEKPKNQNEAQKPEGISKEEAKKKIDKLPENVKEGFRILGYSAGGVYQFCSKFNWSIARIEKEINTIVDSKNAGMK